MSVSIRHFARVGQMRFGSRVPTQDWGETPFGGLRARAKVAGRAPQPIGDVALHPSGELVEPWLVGDDSEPEVEAEPDRLGVEIERGWTAAEGAGGSGCRIEAVVEILDPGREVGCEHVLDAGAGHPADVRVGEAGAEGGAGDRVRRGVVDVGPG